MTLGSKYPCLINLTDGAVGAFVSLVEVKSEKDHVKIKYVPFNKIKPVISDNSYPKTSIVRIIPDNTKIPGVMQDYVVIFEDANGKATFLDKIQKDVIDKISKYKEEARVKELEAVQQKYRAREAKEESAKQISRDEELKSTKNRRRQEDVFGRPRDRFGRFIEDNDDDYF